MRPLLECFRGSTSAYGPSHLLIQFTDASGSTQLKISYLQQNLQRGLPVLDTPMIPERLDYTNERTLPDASDQGPASGAAAMDGISNVFEETQFPEQSLDTPTELSVQTVPTQILPRHGDPASQLDVLQQVVDPSSASPSSDRSPKSHDQQLHESPPRNVAEMRAAFPAMMQPEEFTQGDTQTQEPFHQHHPAASETTASPSRAAASPTAKSDYDMETSRPNLELSQATTARLEQERIGRRPRTRSRSKPAQRKSQDAVACQCGCTEEDDDMVR